jgi:putative DNA methylase
LTEWGDLFTDRQLVALTTFSDLVLEVRERVKRDALGAGMPDDGSDPDEESAGASAYADAVATYLGLATSRWCDLSNAICTWNHANQNVRALFSRQAIPMSWDYTELSPFSKVGSWFSVVESSVEASKSLVPTTYGRAWQADASQQSASADRVVSTDPPYYDNIGYADLSDFFYVWLRRSLQKVFPDLFSTVATPKAEELVATAYRHGGKEEAEAFFLAGMTRAIGRIPGRAHPAFPVTIYYAFKQSERDLAGGISSTGWETFLDAVVHSGFSISGTWPMRTERATRSVGIGANALASSVILVCRPRLEDAPIATRRDFLQALRAELPEALRHLQHGNIAPVDLAQSAIGPGMAVYTRFAKVLDADGSALSIRDALGLINQSLDEVLEEQEGEFDADTRWAVAWFDQCGFGEAAFGDADNLARAKGTSVEGMVRAGIVESGRSKVRLLRPNELPTGWDPVRDERLTVWEATHHLVRALDQGEQVASDLARRLGGIADAARDLAYRLYVVCERKKRAPEALAYNALVESWPEIQRLGAVTASAPVQQQIEV